MDLDPKSLPFSLPTQQIQQFCIQNHIMKLGLFGSVLRADFNEDSDIDVLVEFEKGHVPGLAFFNMQQQLSQMLGKKVDLNTKHWLSRHFRDDVISQQKIIYDQT